MSSEAVELPNDLIPDATGSQSNHPPGASSKMKSSGIDEFDIEVGWHSICSNGYLNMIFVLIYFVYI